MRYAAEMASSVFVTTTEPATTDGVTYQESSFVTDTFLGMMTNATYNTTEFASSAIPG